MDQIRKERRLWQCVWSMPTEFLVSRKRESREAWEIEDFDRKDIRKLHKRLEKKA